MNSSNNDTSLHDQLHRTTMIIQFIEVSGMTCANLVVIALYLSMKREQKKISNYLLLSQSITDLYNALMMWYDLIITLTHIKHTALELVKITMLEYSFTLSLGTLLLGALERYLAITKPYYHKRNITMIRIVYSTVAVWVFSLVPPSILLALMKYTIMNFNSDRVIMYSFVFDAVMLGMIIFVVTILILTLSTARASCREKTTKLTRHHKCPQRNQRNKSTRSPSFKKRLRLVVIFMIMMVLYIVTFLPLTIGRVLYDTGTVKNLPFFDNMVIIIVCHTLYKSSALFNPFLTLCLKEDYRRTFTNLFKPNRRSRSQTNKESVILITQVSIA